MTDEGLKAWWPDLAIIVLDLRRIGEHVAADGLVASAAKGTTSSEVLGEVGSVLEQNRELQPRLGAPARSAWKRVMADVHGAFPGRRVARWLPMPTAAGRGTAWLRALLYLPFLLAALVLVKDRLVILDYEILSGGQTGVQLLLMRAAAFLALVACGTSGFLLYFILMLHPLADLFTKMRKPALIIAGAVFGSLAAILWVDDFATNELRHVQWAIERIAANGWRVEPCSRDTGICIHWEGRMGRATVKSQAGSRDAANAAIAQWRDANRQGADLLVEWGTTPAGWLGVRSASAGNLKLSNRWRGG